MKTLDFYSYAYNAIDESIKALKDHKNVKEYYGDSDECTIENYFSSQIDGGNVYDHTQEFSEELLIGSVEDLKDEFERAREQAFKDYLTENWKEIYEDEIREFLQENYFDSGKEIGVDYSVYINIESGEIFEKVEASSNWTFLEYDENRKKIVHLDNYNKPMYDWTDLVATESNKTIEENLQTELPEDFEEMDFDEKIEWIENNVDSKNLDEYNKIQRDEAIDKIIEYLKEE